MEGEAPRVSTPPDTASPTELEAVRWLEQAIATRRHQVRRYVPAHLAEDPAHLTLEVPIAICEALVQYHRRLIIEDCA